MNKATTTPSNPHTIIAGIRQFGLASDGSDLRDLEAAIDRLSNPAIDRAQIIEECAKVAEQTPISLWIEEDFCAKIAAAIRALSTER